MINNTVSLLPSNNENQLMLTMIDEAMRLFGFQCLLIDYKDITMYLFIDTSCHILVGRKDHSIVAVAE